MYHFCPENALVYIATSHNLFTNTHTTHTKKNSSKQAEHTICKKLVDQRAKNDDKKKGGLGGISKGVSYLEIYLPSQRRGNQGRQQQK